MKKLIFAAAISLLLCAGGAVLWAHVSSDEFFDANAEALIDTRGVNYNIVDCYSESDHTGKSGDSYYDCGKCERITGAKRDGKRRECVVIDGGGGTD